MENESVNDGSGLSDSRRSIWRRVIAVIVVLLIGGLGTTLYYAVQEARNAALAIYSQSRLNQLSSALFNYHQAYGCFPPAYIPDKEGKPMHSWRALVLPYVEGVELYKSYNLKEPWNGPHNSKLADKMPKGFHVPSEPPSTSMTNVVAITGPGTIFPGSKSTKYSDITDGRGNTILLTEIADSDINWLEPRDLHVERMSFEVNNRSKPSISTSRPKGPFVVFANSIHAYRISPLLSPAALKSLTTIAGRERMCMAEVRGVGLVDADLIPVTADGVKKLRNLGEVRSLWLGYSNVTDEEIPLLAALPHLSLLHLRGTGITDKGVRKIARLPCDFVELDLLGTRITDAGVEGLKNMQRLSHLNLRNTGVTLSGISQLLLNLPQLTVYTSESTISGRELYLSDPSVTDADLVPLRGNKRFRDVDLSNTGVTDAIMPFLGENTELYHLELDGTHITDEGLRHLAKLKELHELDLSRTKITDEGLRHLAELKELHELDLSRTKITDEGLRQLAGLKELRVLNLANTQITDAGLEHLSELADLRELDLSGTHVTDQGIRQIKDLSNLYSLNLNDTQISDASIKHLKKITRCVLLLKGTGITDAVVDDMQEIVQLRKLDLRDTAVSSEAVKKIQDCLPRCTIVR